MDSPTLKLVLIAGLVIAALSILTRKSELFAAYDPTDDIHEAVVARAAMKGKKAKKNKNAAFKPNALLKASTRSTVGGASVNLLPKTSGDAGFAQFAPDPKMVSGQNFVDASRWVSLGAMSSRRNISRDLRSDVAIAKSNGVSPWNNSTIDQIQAGKPLDCP
jgi:hypothetical protein